MQRAYGTIYGPNLSERVCRDKTDTAVVTIYAPSSDKSRIEYRIVSYHTISYNGVLLACTTPFVSLCYSGTSGQVDGSWFRHARTSETVSRHDNTRTASSVGGRDRSPQPTKASPPDPLLYAMIPNFSKHTAERNNRSYETAAKQQFTKRVKLSCATLTAALLWEDVFRPHPRGESMARES